MSIRAITISAAASSLLTFAAPARAQVNGWLHDRPGYATDDYRTSQYDARRVAYDNGYKEGLEHGTDAARDRRPMNIEREKDFREADEGYNRSLGSRDRYRESFRSGFAEGYREAYRRVGYNRGGYNGDDDDESIGVSRERYPYGYPSTGYPGYGGYGGYVNVAFQNGVNDGYQKGLDDARDGKYPDMTRQRWYRSGDRNYDGRYGSRDEYRNQYRAGFQNGYNRAYSEARSGGYRR